MLKLIKCNETSIAHTTQFVYNSRFIAAAYSHKKLFPSKCSNFTEGGRPLPPPSSTPAGLLTSEILSL